MELIFTDALRKSNVSPAVMILFFNSLQSKFEATPKEKICIMTVKQTPDTVHVKMVETIITFSTLYGQEKFSFRCYHAVDMSCSNSGISKLNEPICLCGVNGRDEARCPKHRDVLTTI